jgi:hypothetical protein
MEVIVGKAASAPHRPGGSKSTVAGRHAGTADGRRMRCSATASEVRSPCPIDLLGRTGLARLHLRVRFGLTDKLPALGSLEVSLDLWTGGNA